jgi:hypothetical protein
MQLRLMMDELRVGDRPTASANLINRCACGFTDLRPYQPGVDEPRLGAGRLQKLKRIGLERHKCQAFLYLSK